MRVLKLIKKQEKYINAKKWQELLDTMDEKIHENAINYNTNNIYLEIGDYKKYSERYFVSNIIYFASENDCQVSNILRCLYLNEVNKCRMIDGSFIYQTNQRIKNMKNIIDLCNLPLLKVSSKLTIVSSKNENDFIVLRLNSSLNISTLKVNGHIAKYTRVSMLNNIIIIRNIHDEFINNECDLDIEYSGYPDFQEPSNYISDIVAINISYETNLFPIINFLPIDIYEFTSEFIHPVNSVICAAGKVRTIMENMEENYKISIFDSIIDSHCNCLLMGEYLFYEKKGKNIDVCIFYNKTCIYNIGRLANIVIECFDFYSLLLEFYPPYDIINVCIDEKLVNTSYAQANMICLKNDNIDIVSHEVAHLWWGSYVTGVGPGWLWFHEAFAEAFSSMYMGKINDIKLDMSEWRDKDILYTSFLGENLKFINKIFMLIGNMGQQDFISKCKRILQKRYIYMTDLNKIFDNKLLKLPTLLPGIKP